MAHKALTINIFSMDPESESTPFEFRTHRDVVSAMAGSDMAAQ
jgi:hypothetical protein